MAVERPGRALVAILGESGREGCDLIRLQCNTVRVIGICVEVAVGLRILEVLLQEQVPVGVESPQQGYPQALVVDRVGVAGN